MPCGELGGPVADRADDLAIRLLTKVVWRGEPSPSLARRSCAGTGADGPEGVAIIAAWLAARSSRLIWGNNRFPKSVSATCGWRWNRGPPRAFSSVLIPVVSDGCDTPQLAAAFLKLFFLQTARKYLTRDVIILGPRHRRSNRNSTAAAGDWRWVWREESEPSVQPAIRCRSPVSQGEIELVWHFPSRSENDCSLSQARLSACDPGHADRFWFGSSARLKKTAVQNGQQI